MQKKLGIPEDYYQIAKCIRCKKDMVKAELKAREKEHFLRLCDECNTVIKEQLKKCLPLMQKLGQR